jgi:hypothetical protein
VTPPPNTTFCNVSLYFHSFLALIPLSFHFISFHFISFHFISFHFTLSFFLSYIQVCAGSSTARHPCANILRTPTSPMTACCLAAVARRFSTALTHRTSCGRSPLPKRRLFTWMTSPAFPSTRSRVSRRLLRHPASNLPRSSSFVAAAWPLCPPSCGPIGNLRCVCWAATLVTTKLPLPCSPRTSTRSYS